MPKSDAEREAELAMLRSPQGQLDLERLRQVRPDLAERLEAADEKLRAVEERGSVDTG